MEWKSWSSVSFTQRTQLLPQPGIYVVVDAEDQVWYVGQSINLNARWNGKGHHRYKQLSRTNNKRDYKIYWKFFPLEQLNEKENLYINLFRPCLNYTKVRIYAKRPTLPNEELSRLLKILNKKTTLFPDVRSIILGYYLEIDEDDQEELKEYICIVVLVNAKDRDGVILNSMKKSLSKKGSSLRGYWQMYESNCEVDNPDIRPASIPVFILENLVYEFVSCPNSIDELAKNKSALYTIEIEKQPVLVLKDITVLTNENIIPPLNTSPYVFMLTAQDYLHYRTKDILPIMDLFGENP